MNYLILTFPLAMATLAVARVLRHTTRRLTPPNYAALVICALAFAALLASPIVLPAVLPSSQPCTPATAPVCLLSDLPRDPGVISLTSTTLLATVLGALAAWRTGRFSLYRAADFLRDLWPFTFAYYAVRLFAPESLALFVYGAVQAKLFASVMRNKHELGIPIPGELLQVIGPKPSYEPDTYISRAQSARSTRI